MVSKLLVIVGSTRPGRAADLVLPWVTRRTPSQKTDREIPIIRLAPRSAPGSA